MLGGLGGRGLEKVGNCEPFKYNTAFNPKIPFSVSLSHIQTRHFFPTLNSTFPQTPFHFISAPRLEGAY